MRINTFFLLFFLFTFLFTGSCEKQGAKDILKQTGTLPVIDGVINESEYTVKIETGKMMLYLARNSKELVFGLTGQTAGWISIGFGSMVMDNSHMIIGYADGNSMGIEEHEGAGHRHRVVEKQILEDAIIKEKDGNTIFEGSIKAQDVIQPGQTEIPIILASGTGDDFTSRHTFRKSIIVMLAEK